MTAGLMYRRGLQQGATYLLLLVLLTINSAVLASAAAVWSHTQRREREQQLLWVGDQFRSAIAAYARAGGTAGAQGADPYPPSLQELLHDSRSLVPRRHLRRIYEDPMTRSSDWGLMRNAQGHIVGVYSRSEEQPIKTGKFKAADAAFEQARRYADWRFSALPQVPQAPDAVPPGATPRTGAAAGVAPVTMPVKGDAAATEPAARPAREDDAAAQPRALPADESG
jgi:type II secretory pathway pseudopilin PulG